MALPLCADADEQDLARAHFTTGANYYGQARYGEALREFEEAYRLSKRVGFLYNIGVCHEQLGQLDQALTAFQGYLGSVNDPAERADVQARIDRLHAMQEGRMLTATAPPPAERPVWKRGWFWGVMAGAAAVVATGVTLGVVLGTNKGPRTLMDVPVQ